MSAETVKTILARAVAEPNFRQLLLRQPLQAVAAYDLTSAEQTALAGLTAERFDPPAAQLDPRVSYVAVPLGLEASLQDAAKQLDGLTPGGGPTANLAAASSSSPTVQVANVANVVQGLAGLVGSAAKSN